MVKSKSKFRLPYDGVSHSSRSYVSEFGDIVPTVQSFKDDCDINVIMDRHAKTGLHSRSSLPLYQGDFASLPDFQEAQDIVRKATESFESLSPSLRARFANDPKILLSFLNDPANLEEARKLGLVKPKECQPQPNAELHSSSDSASVKSSDKPTS